MCLYFALINIQERVRLKAKQTERHTGENERTERKEERHQAAMKGDEKGEIESEGLREERNQGSELDDDSAMKQRANLTERARELTERKMVRGHNTKRETERERNKLEGIPCQILPLCFPPAPLCCLLNG